MSEVTILALNIQNPSLERAAKLASWLQKQKADVIVLSECKNSKGCLLIRDVLQGSSLFSVGKYKVVFEIPKDGEYGVLIASRSNHTISGFSKEITFLQTRASAIILPYCGSELEVIGLYIPTKGLGSIEKRESKQKFMTEILSALKSNPHGGFRVLCGDLNILETKHVPYYDEYKWEEEFYFGLSKFNMVDAFRYLHPTDKEYSWFGKSGDPYRFDHSFISNNLKNLLVACSYIHEPRELKLTDHSAMVTVLKQQNV